MFESLWPVAKLTLLIGGLLLPGGAIARALRLPATLAVWFLGSVVAIYVTVLVLQFTGVTLTRGTLASGLAVIIAGTFVGTRGFRRAGSANGTSLRISSLSDRLFPFLAMGAWTPCYLLGWAVILLRAWLNPLAGPDTEFRWSFLAEQMLARGSLDFYPPRSADDFFHYFWVESIPPGVSALHAWAFACAGQAVAAWTLPALILQGMALHECVGRTAQRYAGVGAARYACLTLMASPLLLWSGLLGQETGLTALALSGIAWALLSWRRDGGGPWPMLLGLFALLGAITREYGLIFPALAAAGLLAGGAQRRAWIEFTAIAVIGVVWPLRTWVLTGNPFYSLGVGGLFPANPRFVAWITADAAALSGVLKRVEGWQDLLRYFLIGTPTALIGWGGLVCSAARGGRAAGWGGFAVAVIVAVWVVSIPYTNGGLFYSMRVLSPALALGSVGAGILLANPHFVSSRTAAFAMSILLVLTLIPNLALPANYGTTPWREWPAFFSPKMAADPTVAAVLNVRASDPTASPADVILADSPGYQKRFATTGLRVVPLWSPQVDGWFDAALPASETRRLWRASGITLLVITKWQTHLDFFYKHSRWAQPPFQVRLVAETSEVWIFAIKAE